MPPADANVFGNTWADYQFRAQVAMAWIYMNQAAEAMYPVLSRDQDGEPLDAAIYTYTLNFSGAPPVNSFWSLTMYDENWFLVENVANRYSISDRSGVVTNPDGSFVLYLQTAPIGTGGAYSPNWLPAPAGKFNLVLRLYCADMDQIKSYVYPSLTSTS